MKNQTVFNFFIFLALIFGPFLLNAGNQPLKYGDRYYIKNLYEGGTYLDSCGGTSCTNGTKYGVSTNTQPNRGGANTGTWIILSATGKKEGTVVLVGDVVYLKNVYGGGSYLDSCGHASCSTNTKYNVTTNTQPNRENANTGKWQIVSATGITNGSQLTNDLSVHLKNVYGGGSYLDVCGLVSCTSGTKYKVTTNSSPNRDGSKTGQWAFQVATNNNTPITTKNKIATNERLKEGEQIVSTNGRYRALVQSDGNFVIYSPKKGLWGTNTHGKGKGCVLVLQGDGNLVLYKNGTALWASNTNGKSKGGTLVMQNDGNLVLYANGKALWASNTVQKEGGVSIEAKEKSIALNNIKSLIDGLNPTHEEFKVKGTYSTKHLFDTYSAGIQHIQGVAYHNGRWYFTHNARDGKSKSLIVVSNASTDKSNFFLEGKYNHPGAIQNCNTILAVSMEHGNHSEVMFYDLTNPDYPSLLPTKITRNKKAGAVGITYHHQEKCHYVMVEYGPGPEHFDLYKSNGQSLLSDQCSFTLVGTDEDVKNCQGGTQLLYEGNTGKLYLGGLYRDGGWEKIYLAEVNTSTGKLTEITTKKLSNSITSTDYQAGFRWGGCFIPKNANSLEVYGVARTLTYGPAQNYTKVKKWSRKKYVKIYNAGAYDAKFRLTYTSGGASKTKTGRLSVGQWKTYTTAWDASGFHLKADAVLGNNILNRYIDANKCYRLKGTTLFNSFDNACN